MQDNGISFAQARAHLRRRPIFVPNLNLCETSTTRPDQESHPISAVAKQCTGGDLQNVVAPPGDDARFDAKAIAQGMISGKRIDKVHPYFDALFLDTQCGDFREAARLDDADFASQWFFSTPLLDGNLRARADPVSYTHLTLPTSDLV